MRHTNTRVCSQLRSNGGSTLWLVVLLSYQQVSLQVSFSVYSGHAFHKVVLWVGGLMVPNAPRCSAEGLSRVPRRKKAVASLSEEIVSQTSSIQA